MPAYLFMGHKGEYCPTPYSRLNQFNFLTLLNIYLPLCQFSFSEMVYFEVRPSSEKNVHGCSHDCIPLPLWKLRELLFFYVKSWWGFQSRCFPKTAPFWVSSPEGFHIEPTPTGQSQLECPTHLPQRFWPKVFCLSICDPVCICLSLTEAAAVPVTSAL